MGTNTRRETLQTHLHPKPNGMAVVAAAYETTMPPTPPRNRKDQRMAAVAGAYETTMPPNPPRNRKDQRMAAVAGAYETVDRHRDR